MEVPKIDDVHVNVEICESGQKNEVVSSSETRRKCVFDRQAECTAPNCDRKICEKCPYAAPYSFSASVRDVFNKIIGLAIYLAKSDDVMRDVMGLISKDKGQGTRVKGQEEIQKIKGQGSSPPASLREALRAGVKGQEEKAKYKGQEEELQKTEDLIERAQLHITKAEVTERPAGKNAAGLRTMMNAEIADKIAAIEDALADPDGSPGQFPGE